MVASPSNWPVTLPSSSTVATSSLLLDHVTSSKAFDGLTLTDKVISSPKPMLWSVGPTIVISVGEGAITLIVIDVLTLLSALQLNVITAVPIFVVVTMMPFSTS